MDSYTDWLDIYSEHREQLHSVWLGQTKELRRFSILQLALKQEFEVFKKTIEELELKRQYLQSKINSENRILKEIQANRASQSKREVLKENDGKVKETNFLFNENCNDIVPSSQPNLSRHARLTPQVKPKISQPTIKKTEKFFGNLSDEDIIENTPEVVKKPLKLNKSKLQSLKKRNFEEGKTIKPHSSFALIINSKTKEFNKKKDETMMEITEIIEEINKPAPVCNVGESQTFCESPTKVFESPPSPLLGSDSGSRKKIRKKLETSSEKSENACSISPKNINLQPSSSLDKAEPTVRGKARKLLPGWSCESCKKFYECQDLTEEELKKKIQECSRHRSKHKKDDDTFDGFWGLTIGSPK